MNINDYITKNFGISNKVIDLICDVENKIKPKFEEIEEVANINQLKVLKAFGDNKVSTIHFAYTTGYGYDDIGRDTLDAVYAQAFGAEDAIVRHTIISGTHAISTALFGVLRPNDTLLSVTGKPYDTLEQVIGISGEAGNGSLADFGVKYEQVDLTNLGLPNFEEIKNKIDTTTKAVLIQRSKGYSWRPTLSVSQIGELVKYIKAIKSDVICIVDNCYGEFVEGIEPCDVGADLIIGSLIKNPGGGLAPTGGYIAGKKSCIELVANRLTTVGVGKECGCSLGVNQAFYQGFFMAPHIVSQAIKAAVLCAGVFESLGYEVLPTSTQKRSDIIQSVNLKSSEGVVSFCQGIQKGAPVDSFVVPVPWDMPGYQNEVIMAAGSFVQGASIELSADAPIKEPYIAYMQGGLTYESARLGIMVATENMFKIQ